MTFNKENCKQRIFSGWNNYQCSRKAVKDGYCKQHHPDTVKALREKSCRKFEEDSYHRSKRGAFCFVHDARKEDLKLLSEAINKRYEQKT